MSWADFRKKVIGATNPSFAHPESLRSIMNTEWEELGLAGPLDTMRNGIHASASAFEALVERSIWLGVSLESDKQFGVDLFSSTVPASVLKEWTNNPLVRGKYIFDRMENQGSEQCLETALALQRNSTAGTVSNRIVIMLLIMHTKSSRATSTSCPDSPTVGHNLSPIRRPLQSKPRSASPELLKRGGSSSSLGQPLVAPAPSAMHPMDRRRLPALSPLGRCRSHAVVSSLLSGVPWVSLTIINCQLIANNSANKFFVVVSTASSECTTRKQ